MPPHLRQGVLCLPEHQPEAGTPARPAPSLLIQLHPRVALRLPCLRASCKCRGGPGAARGPRTEKASLFSGGGPLSVSPPRLRPCGSGERVFGCSLLTEQSGPRAWYSADTTESDDQRDASPSFQANSSAIIDHIFASKAVVNAAIPAYHLRDLIKRYCTCTLRFVIFLFY